MKTDFSFVLYHLESKSELVETNHKQQIHIVESNN